MKKAKILVPAMGMMLLSTAAAVSGTMAWFSASRSVEVSANDFAVEAIDGALTVAASELIGPATLSNQNKTIALQASHNLADASFNYRSGAEKLYTDTVDANDNINGYQDLGDVDTVATAWEDTAAEHAAADTWNVPGSASTHYGFAFKLTFSYDFKQDTRTLGLFFNALADDQGNHLGSYVTNQTVTAGSNGDNTYKGFRMAFIGNADRFVWAPNRTSSDVYDDPTDDPDAGATVAIPHKTVTGTAVNALTAIPDADLILKDSDVAQATNGTDTTNKGYLGTIAKPNGETTGTTEVVVVVWYEGTDPAVVNASSMDKVSSVLKFYVRAQQA